jgi:hypothetical protein
LDKKETGTTLLNKLLPGLNYATENDFFCNSVGPEDGLLKISIGTIFQIKM